jgi:hypothetical protein
MARGKILMPLYSMTTSWFSGKEGASIRFPSSLSKKLDEVRAKVYVVPSLVTGGSEK